MKWALAFGGGALSGKKWIIPDAFLFNVGGVHCVGLSRNDSGLLRFLGENNRQDLNRCKAIAKLVELREAGWKEEERTWKEGKYEG